MKLANNTSGKILTIFSVIIAVLLITLTAASMFYMQKEKQQREMIELRLSRSAQDLETLKAELEETKAQSSVLEEKNKELDEKINSLLDELDLAEGLRDEIKKENAELKERLEKESTAGKKYKEKLTSLTNFEEKMAELQTQLQIEKEAKNALEKKLELFESRQKEMQEYVSQVEQGAITKLQEPAKEKSSLKDEATQEKKTDVNLEPIVVAPANVPEGRILSVDKETEFVIVNLGEKDGVAQGSILSVYRGKEYLGDVKITRVQTEMSAADLIPPFSSRVVRKNDQVVTKQ